MLGIEFLLFSTLTDDKDEKIRTVMTTLEIFLDRFVRNYIEGKNDLLICREVRYSTSFGQGPVTRSFSSSVLS